MTQNCPPVSQNLKDAAMNDDDSREGDLPKAELSPEEEEQYTRRYMRRMNWIIGSVVILAGLFLVWLIHSRTIAQVRLVR
jgi:hypothetical protein